MTGEANLPPRDGVLVPPALAGVLKLGILAGALAFLLQDLGGRIDGEHYWRQTHVAANIERFRDLGPSLRPTTYNHDAPVLVFDFPAYQLLASGVSRLLGTESLATSRAVNVALFVGTFLAIERLLAATQVGPLSSLVCLFAFASAPLGLFYFHAPMVDGLAVFLTLLSLAAVPAWSAGRRSGWLVVVLSGALATFVKNPVYLPVPIAIALFQYRRHGWEGLRSREFLSYVGVIGLSVLAFKVYSNHVNGIGAFLTARESAEYFGTLHDRLRLKFWAPVLLTMLTRGGGPFVLVLAALGGLLYAFQKRGAWAPLYQGLGLGTLVTLVIFLDKFNAHSYYCLPLLFPAAFFAGEAVEALALPLVRRGGWALVLPGLALLLVGTLVTTRRGLLAMSVPVTEEIATSGDWIRGQTQPDDFVFYLLPDEESGWLPAFLYFARREGYNLPYTRFSEKGIQGLIRTLGLGRRRLVVYCPDSVRDELHPNLRSVLAPLRSSDLGALYVIDTGELARNVPSRADAPTRTAAGVPAASSGAPPEQGASSSGPDTAHD